MEDQKIKTEVGKSFIPYQTFPENNYLPVLDNLLKREIITYSEKEMLRILNKFSYKDGECFPGQKRLEDEIGLKNGQVRNILRSLENKGFIRIDRPKPIQRHLFRKHNSYFFLWHIAYYDYVEKSNISPIDTENNAKNDTGTPIYTNQKVSIPKKTVPVLSAHGQESVSASAMPEYRKELVTLSAEADKQSQMTGKRFSAASFIGHALKSGIHPQAILDALKQLINAMPIISEPWAYANRILSIRSGNYHEREMVRAAAALKSEPVPAGFGALLSGIGGAL
ncbi:MAG: helix-turn-helix domain-containing protein [Desulfococcaceae bacterium]|nr:helix-turn-helix domain-containing protein [Desulfococcaceae bacterium]